MGTKAVPRAKSERDEPNPGGISVAGADFNRADRHAVLEGLHGKSDPVRLCMWGNYLVETCGKLRIDRPPG